MNVAELAWDAAGLVSVVVQDRHSGEVRMLAHANEEAVRKTLESGDGWFFSRSRQALWRKGESSGNTLRVIEVWADCDGDALLYLVDPTGPSCHTGKCSCFFERLDGGAELDDSAQAAPTLVRLWDALVDRQRATAARSYTRSLLDAGVGKIGAKVREEADETARALSGESDERVVSEAADVVYHLLVGLLARGLALRDVAAELARRFGTSGHDEKASRGR